MRFCVILILALIVTGCSKSPEDKLSDLEELVLDGISSSGDYWIIKQGDYYTDRYYKVGLVFGYGDNQLACTEMLSAYRKVRPTDHVQCVAASELNDSSRFDLADYAPFSPAGEVASYVVIVGPFLFCVIWWLYGRQRYRLHVAVHWQDQHKGPATSEMIGYALFSVLPGFVHALYTVGIGGALLYWIFVD
jgi:hypothetical protein|tara:strand:+ start:1841 stop:2413 length:573 start_codon:yes stop_codon:yes gene_type:complete